MKKIWWFISVGCRLFLVLCFISCCGYLFFPPFGSFAREFTDLAGEQAAPRMGYSWPDVVPPKDVVRVCGKINSSIDSRACWFKVTLQPDIAEKWQEAIHSKLEKSARLERLTEVVEGVHRTVNDPPPKETRDGKAPKWWQLPSRPFRLTERMRWGSGANYADAVYSCFDPSTNTLWIVDISEQHGELWVRGNVPNGRQFLLSRPNNLNPQNVEIHPPNDLEAKGGELKKDLVPQVDENR
jgi:hypothetical protein